MDINDIKFNKGDFDFVKTAESTDEVLSRLHENKVYGEILSVLADGNVSMEMRKRILLRAVDEAWVTVIEESLPALDEIVRRPARYLEENELLLPIELTRKVTPRSIQHLSQHTGLISEVREDESIIPSKLLNVFRDETMNTYENRFINTLLNKLYTFVTMRYDVASTAMADTESTTLTVDQTFTHGKAKGKIKVFIELEQPYSGESPEKNYLKTTDLWKRIERLYNVAKEYASSDFAKTMGKLYIRPPVMRTNAILKNKNLRQCLALWQFIETYTQTGAAYQVTETLENVSPEYVKDLYSMMAVDYAIFRYRTEKGFNESEEIAKYTADVPLTPHIVEDLKPTETEEYDYHFGVGQKMPCTLHELTEVDEDILTAIRICLDAYDMDDLALETEVEEEVVVRNGINRSFLAKLIQSSQTVQGYYGTIKNEFLSYKKVKSRISWNYDSINRGRLKLGKFVIRGKTLVLYLNLDPNEFDTNKYHHKDASDVKRYADTPFMLKIRSDRALKYALELIAVLAEKFSLVRGETQNEDYFMPYETDYALFKRGLIKVYGDYVVDTGEKLISVDAQGNRIETVYDKEDAAAAAEDAAEDAAAEVAEAVQAAAEAEAKAAAEAMAETLRRGVSRSFLAKLIQSNATLQGYYGAIKNELLSYKKVKSRISWNYDSFTSGRQKLAKTVIRGKTLVLYLNLDPNGFDTDKYHHKDASDVKKYADTPFMLKIRSDRALRYALELIAILAERFSLVRGETQSEDYFMPYEDDVALLERSLIKVSGSYVVEDGRIIPVDENGNRLETLIDREDAEEAAQAADEQAEAEDAQAYKEKERTKEPTAIPRDHPLAPLVPEDRTVAHGTKIKYVKDDSPVVLSDIMPVFDAEQAETDEEDFDEEERTPSPDEEVAEEAAQEVAEEATETVEEVAQEVAEETAETVQAATEAETAEEVTEEVAEEAETAEEVTEETTEEVAQEATETVEEVAQEAETGAYEAEEQSTEQAYEEIATAETAAAKDSSAETPTAQEIAVSVSPEQAADDGGEASVYDAFSVVRYRRSFTAKMVEADEQTKYYYSVIKSEMLKSKAVKWRISWGFDTFNIGREKLARITIIGKTLVLYLNLDPSRYSETKYRHSDASDVSKVKDTPLMLKVRSERALRHAQELIFDLYAKYELMINNYNAADWTFPPMTFEEMLEQGYIRLEGNSPAPQATAVNEKTATEITTEAVEQQAEEAVETVEEVAETAEEQLPEEATEAVEEAEETAEEQPEAVERLTEDTTEAVKEAEETAEEQTEAVEQPTEETTETVEETAEAAEEQPEAVEQPPEDTTEAVKEAEETAEEQTEAVEQPPEDTTEAVEEAEETAEEQAEAVEQPTEETTETVEEVTETAEKQPEAVEEASETAEEQPETRSTAFAPIATIEEIEYAEEAFGDAEEPSEEATEEQAETVGRLPEKAAEDAAETEVETTAEEQAETEAETEVETTAEEQAETVEQQPEEAAVTNETAVEKATDEQSGTTEKEPVTRKLGSALARKRRMTRDKKV